MGITKFLLLTRTLNYGDMLPYKELIVWQKAFKLSLSVYRETESFPTKETYGLQSQIRRATISIPSNIAEGNKRGTMKDYTSFLRIAHGSGAELETQLLLAKELGYIKEEKFSGLEKDLEEVMKMLGAMIKKTQ